jgi:putative hydrolase of HD superfamily
LDFCNASNEHIDVLKVIKMVLIHDIVEIDAGDTFCYDMKAYEDKLDRENKAANRIFNILPLDQKDEMLALWQEFELMQTNEAKFSAALDRLQPVLLNYSQDGKSWLKNKVKYQQVIDRNSKIAFGSEQLWEYLKPLIDECNKNGILP